MLKPLTNRDRQPYLFVHIIQTIVGAPFFPSPPFVIKKMLTLACMNSGSVVYDLGCGEGSIAVAAARDYNARKVVGIE